MNYGWHIEEVAGGRFILTLSEPNRSVSFGDPLGVPIQTRYVFVDVHELLGFLEKRLNK